jgi:hypothetical protein
LKYEIAFAQNWVSWTVELGLLQVWLRVVPGRFF